MQELTEGSNTAGGAGEGADRVDDSVSESQSPTEQAGKMEQVESKQEVAAALPARRSSTSTPSNLPVRLLTRLGSLDGEFQAEAMLREMLPCWFIALLLFPRSSSSTGEKVPSHLTQELHSSQRPSQHLVARADLDAPHLWVSPPRDSSSSPAP